jgi:aspartate 1-decarboxylase
VGDLLIIATFANFEEAEIAAFHPALVFVDGDNRIKEIKHHAPVQAA